MQETPFRPLKSYVSEEKSYVREEKSYLMRNPTRHGARQVAWSKAPPVHLMPKRIMHRRCMQSGHAKEICMKLRLPPGLTLLLMGPLLGELVSGHQTPADFFNPLTFIILCLPYGFGAVVCRELVVRWGKGGISLLLLGIAYGLWEEGMVVRSIFNPDWTELEKLGEYGHVGGITWPWLFMLVHFHSVISIGCSVLLTEVMYPTRRHESWVGRKGFLACLLGLGLWLPVGYMMTSYQPPVPLYLAAWACLIGLVLAARILPARMFEWKRIKSPNPLVFLALGAINTPVMFAGVFVPPEHGWPPLWVTMTGLFLFDLVCLWLAMQWSGGGRAWDDRHRLALVAGCLGFLIFACTLADLEEGWTGKSGVAVLAILGLILIWRRVSKREQAASDEDAACASCS